MRKRLTKKELIELSFPLFIKLLINKEAKTLDQKYKNYISDFLGVFYPRIMMAKRIKTKVPRKHTEENAQYFFGDGTNMTVPTSSVFTVGNNAQVNAASKNYIAYCWHSVEGHSKIGAYTGNGDADGTFVYTGFRPAFLMQKRINASGQMWMITDSARDPYNAVDDYVQVNSNNAEADYDFFDFTATGFKHRHTSTHSNGSGDTYIYMAFAETPAKYANAK